MKMKNKPRRNIGGRDATPTREETKTPEIVDKPLKEMTLAEQL